MKPKWLVLDDDNGWKVVIPESDILPHGFPENNTAEIEYSNCPCKPEVNLLSQIIIHNSFEEQKKIDESINKLSNLSIKK